MNEINFLSFYLAWRHNGLLHHLLAALLLHAALFQHMQGMLLDRPLDGLANRNHSSVARLPELALQPGDLHDIQSRLPQRLLQDPLRQVQEPVQQIGTSLLRFYCHCY
jgi:hypothetical protein